MIKRIATYTAIIMMASTLTANASDKVESVSAKSEMDISVMSKESLSLKSKSEEVEIKAFRDHIADARKEYEAEQERIKAEAIKKKREEERLARLEEERIAAERAYLESLPLNFNPYNLREKSNITVDKAYKILEGTSLQSLAATYVECEQIYGINALFLMGLNAQESGWGDSELSVYNNNIGGVKNGDLGWAYFSSKAECLHYIASFLNEDYLTYGGQYYFGESIWQVRVKYCQDDTDWEGNIIQIINKLINNLN